MLKLGFFLRYFVNRAPDLQLINWPIFWIQNRLGCMPHRFAHRTQ